MACKPDRPALPEGVIPLPTMAVILKDMHIADSVAETKAQSGGNEQLLTNDYYQQIYKNHGITAQEFAKSYKFYEDNPTWLNDLYAEVLTELSKEQANVSK